MINTWARVCGIATVSLVTALALSGCVRLGINLEVSDSDRVSGSVVVAALDQWQELAGEEGDLERLVDSYASVPGARESGYDQDGYRGSEIRFDGVSIADFSNPSSGDAPITIRREGDNIELRGSFDFSAINPEDFGGEGTFTTRTVATEDLGELYVRVTLPGDIVSTNGVVDEVTNTVSWRLRAGEPNRLSATAYSPPGLPLWIWGAIGASALALGAVGIWFALRKRSPEQPAPGDTA